MIDWLKYLPIELRRVEPRQNHPTPKGPSFSMARTKRYRICGSELSFKAPRHRPSHSAYKPFNTGNFRDLLEFPFHEFSRGAMPDDSWMFQSVFNRSFAFYGPWFSGAQYQLDMSITLLTQRAPQEGVSFFHPRAFENVLADYLTSLYGHRSYGQKMRWLAPVNWLPRKTLPVPAVVFDIIPAIDLPAAHRRQLLCLPVSDNHLLEVVLYHDLFEHNMAASTEERKNYFDIGPMETLANDIINSFDLKLSLEIQAQLDRVKAECPNMSLVEDFPPLKWTADGANERQDEPKRLAE